VVDPSGELECPRCGAGVTATQEYCLECGLRLPETARAGWASPASGWAWPVLVALVVAVISAAAVVGARATRDDREPLLVATTAMPAAPETEAPEAATTTPAPPAAPPPPTASRPQSRGLVEWPAGTDGYTLVLASLPEPTGRDRAVAIAREARNAGLPQVGVLRSSRFGSLHPGYFVIFSGVYETAAAAGRGIATAQRAGYEAYVRPIAS
jgi:hypothetical protein